MKDIPNGVVHPRNGVVKHRRTVSHNGKISYYSNGRIEKGNGDACNGLDYSSELLIPCCSTDSLTEMATTDLSSKGKQSVLGYDTASEHRNETKMEDEEFEAAASYVDVFTIGGYVTLQL